MIVTLYVYFKLLILVASWNSAAFVKVGGQVINVSAAGGTTVAFSMDLAQEKEELGEWIKNGNYRYALAKRVQLMLTEHWGKIINKKYMQTPRLPEVYPFRVHSMHPGTSLVCILKWCFVV